jgi:hypothetical protein
MEAKPNGGMMTAVVLIACFMAASAPAAVARPPEDTSSAIVGAKTSDQEKDRIDGLSEANLVNLIKTGTYGQKEAAVKVLAGRGKGDMLLAAAKAGPRAASEVIIEGYVPKARPEGDANAKAAVDAYLDWLEEQLKAKSPVIGPDKAIRSLSRVVFWDSAQYDTTSDKPVPPPPYQHQRVVNVLIGLLKGKGKAVSDAAALELGGVGGYAAEQAQAATAALKAYKEAVAAETSATKKEKENQESRLHQIDFAIDLVKRDWDFRLRFAGKGHKDGNPTPATAPAAGSAK